MALCGNLTYSDSIVVHFTSTDANILTVPYFFNQTPQLLFFSLLVFLRLLFEGGVYFFGKLADINDGWIRYVQAIQRRLLDAVSSMRSLSVLLSSVETHKQP